jgi:hypothetical protein
MRSKVLGGLAVSLLVLVSSSTVAAQSQGTPTAADIDRMLKESEESGKRTQKLIDDAKAAIRPVSEFAHLPPPATVLGAYSEKLMVSVESGYAMKIRHAENGMPLVTFVNLDATPLGGFLTVGVQPKATAQHVFYNLHETPFAQCPANGRPRTTSANRDGSDLGFNWSCGGDRRGAGVHYYSYSLVADGPGLKATFNSTSDQGASSTEHHVYLPITEERVAAAAERLRQRYEEEQRRQAALRAERAEAERQKRQASQERVRSFNRAMEGLNGVLTDAAAESGGYDEAQANLDATVANIQDAAAAERRQQALATQQPTTRAAQEQRQQPEPATPPARVPTPAPVPAADGVAAGEPLRFVMTISLRNLAGDKVNPTCYSNLITRPGPPGWGAPGFLPPGSAEQAQAVVLGLKGEFIAKCRASGRDITSEGNFSWISNQSQYQAQQLDSTRAKYREDVSVQLN